MSKARGRTVAEQCQTGEDKEKKGKKGGNWGNELITYEFNIKNI